MPHRAGPGAAHVGELDVPLLQDFQRGEEFVAEHVLAPPDVGLRRQHADRVVRQLVAAERGLAAPDRQDHLRRHAVALLDRRRASRDAGPRASCPAPRAARSRIRARSRRASARTRPAAAAAAPAFPGSTRSGSDRSGSSPRVAASKVARDTPSFCASRPQRLDERVERRVGSAAARLKSTRTPPASRPAIRMHRNVRLYDGLALPAA